MQVGTNYSYFTTFLQVQTLITSDKGRIKPTIYFLVYWLLFYFNFPALVFKAEADLREKFCTALCVCSNNGDAGCEVYPASRRCGQQQPSRWRPPWPSSPAPMTEEQSSNFVHWIWAKALFHCTLQQLFIFYAAEMKPVHDSPLYNG